MAIFSTLLLRFLPPEALLMISFFFEIIHMAAYSLIKLLQISCWFALLNEVLQSLTFAIIVYELFIHLRLSLYVIMVEITIFD